jgi:hypothetical protein
VGVVGLLAGLYLLLDRLVETGREQIERKLTVVVPKAVKDRKAGDILAHVAGDFQWEGLDKAGFGMVVEKALPSMSALEIWDVRFPEGRPRTARPAKVVFYVKPKGNVNPAGEAFGRCEAVFVREPDGQWRLQTFAVFFPPTSDTPVQVRPYVGG